MFGRRPDGRRVAQKDAIVALAPYLMPTRVDAQVHSVQRVDCDTLTQYIRKQRDQGEVFSYLDLVTAAYVRTVSQHPELNRFIFNKQFYARNTICVSLAVLKVFDEGDEIQESVIKVHFKPTDTLYDIRDRLRAEIDQSRKPEVINRIDKVARFLMMTPGLPTVVANSARLLDRYGLLPRVLVNISPFHTGLFITNMMSLGMPYVNHHLYNFGNTSVFISLGKVESAPVIAPGGTVKTRRNIPIGVVNDERVASGAAFARAFSCWRDMLAHPEALETPPESVRYDIPPKMPRRSGRRLRKRNRDKIQSAV